MNCHNRNVPSTEPANNSPSAVGTDRLPTTKEINKRDLLARGWTEGAIATFLPETEIEVRHAYMRGDYLVHLWDPHAVAETEKKPEVQ